MIHNSNRAIFLILIPMFLSVGCFAKAPMMTRSTFNTIQEGEAVVEMQRTVGNPYQIRSIAPNMQEYEYIERIDLGMETVEENHYYISVKEGVVVGKRMNTQTPPAYDEIYDDNPNDVELQ